MELGNRSISLICDFSEIAPESGFSLIQGHLKWGDRGVSPSALGAIRASAAGRPHSLPTKVGARSLRLSRPLEQSKNADAFLS